uniref:Secreted protein n=1 Tax=Steinernema glaseri TaxID=37863 RepID=A0A1I8ACD6_9BILA
MPDNGEGTFMFIPVFKANHVLLVYFRIVYFRIESWHHQRSQSEAIPIVVDTKNVQIFYVQTKIGLLLNTLAYLKCTLYRIHQTLTAS